MPSRQISTLPSNNSSSSSIVAPPNDNRRDDWLDVNIVDSSVSSMNAPPPNQIITPSHASGSTSSSNHQLPPVSIPYPLSATDLFFRQAAQPQVSSSSLSSTSGLSSLQSSPTSTPTSRVHDSYTRLWLDQQNRQELQRRHMTMRR
jgi:hypothetical protein